MSKTSRGACRRRARCTYPLKWTQENLSETELKQDPIKGKEF